MTDKKLVIMIGEGNFSSLQRLRTNWKFMLALYRDNNAMQTKTQERQILDILKTMENDLKAQMGKTEELIAKELLQWYKQDYLYK